MWSSGSSCQNDNNTILSQKVNVTCLETYSQLAAFIIQKYIHVRYDTAVEHIDNINLVHDLVAGHADGMERGAEGRVFAHAESYSNYVTMEVITSELVRNILLALLAIFLATFVLIADIIASIIVVVNVFLTLINVGE